MQSFHLNVLSASWLGVLTPISPRPLAANIAAVSFVARNLGSSGNHSMPLTGEINGSGLIGRRDE
jgi:hypothetical protein